MNLINSRRIYPRGTCTIGVGRVESNMTQYCDVVVVIGEVWPASYSGTGNRLAAGQLSLDETRIANPECLPLV